MANLGDLMKQAQQLQTRLARIQEETASKTVEASAGGNMVTAVVNGRMELVSLRIDQSVLTSGDTEMLQDLIIAAVNEGIRKAQQMMADAVGKVAGGLKLPGLTA
jgi:DNA-binding YbaB/EbfC family protein